MATRLYDAMFKKGENEIGDLVTSWAKHYANGAITEENVQNYTIVELTGYDTDGNATCKQLSDVKNQGFLVTTVEEDQLMEGETYVDFYNAKGEIIRLTWLHEGVRFDTSAFSLNSGVSKIKEGLVAHFDPKTKKYIVSDKKSLHADYENAYNKFEVVKVDTDFGYAYDKETIRLMSIR